TPLTYTLSLHDALPIFPYDNPTGQFFPQETLNQLGSFCVKHNLWMISDEAYRELFYTKGKTSSIWGIGEKEVPGITGRRISIERSEEHTSELQSRFDLV